MAPKVSRQKHWSEGKNVGQAARRRLAAGDVSNEELTLYLLNISSAFTATCSTHQIKWTRNAAIAVYWGQIALSTSLPLAKALPAETEPRTARSKRGTPLQKVTGGITAGRESLGAPGASPRAGRLTEPPRRVCDRPSRVPPGVFNPPVSYTQSRPTRSVRHAVTSHPQCETRSRVQPAVFDTHSRPPQQCLTN